MQATILSYLPGMFGESIAGWIQEHDDRYVEAQITVEDDVNRYWYENLLGVINFEPKNIPTNLPWPINKTDLELLESTYKEKWICLPTHWYNHLSMTSLPSKGIRVVAETDTFLNLAYALWWIKSHVRTTMPWQGRFDEIDDMIKKGHRYSKELSELKVNYHNWKFLSYKNNILLNGLPDLYHYVKEYHNKYLHRNQSPLILGYEKLSAGEYLELNENYFEKNLALLKDKTSMALNDLTKESFLDNIYNYAKLFCTN